MFLAPLDLSPKIVGDDAKRRDLLHDPVVGSVGLGDPTPGFGVLDESLPVPDEPADIKFVIEDASPASPVAMDCGGAPGLRPRTRDVLGIEGGCDGAGASPGGELPKDALNYLRFARVDGAPAADRFAGRVTILGGT
jgi:hypothetical protein